LGPCLNTSLGGRYWLQFFPIQLLLKWYSSFKKGRRWLNKDILVGATCPHICLPQPCNSVGFRLDNKWKIFNGWKVKVIEHPKWMKRGEEGWKYEELKLHIHSFHNLSNIFKHCNFPSMVSLTEICSPTFDPFHNHRKFCFIQIG
jgi:hypothetical protein